MVEREVRQASRSFSSVGLEHLHDTQKVIRSNRIRTTMEAYKDMVYNAESLEKDQAQGEIIKTISEIEKYLSFNRERFFDLRSRIDPILREETASAAVGFKEEVDNEKFLMIESLLMQFREEAARLAAEEEPDFVPARPV